MRRAFTLIELLIVLAIIAILSAILLPVLSRTRAQAKRTACVSQLRQLGFASAMYRQDFDEIPPHISALHPTYLPDARLLLCPSDVLSGQFAGNNYVEGTKYLQSGVSYEYFPQWDLMQLAGLGWYQPAPNFGPGKWDDLTPYVGCPWHWAKKFDSGAPSSDSRSPGWELMLTMGGSVRKIRVEEPMSQFSPEKYQ
jgi:prepilin-type N-terminal cleavage/methylation domain-containing protein